MSFLRRSLTAAFLSLFVFLYSVPLQAAAKKAPAFSAEDLTGRTYSLSTYRGKPLVLYFWATWCPACVAEAKQMKKLYADYHPKGVAFLSVSLDSDKSKLSKYIDEKNIRYPVVFDGKGWNNEMAKTFGIHATPSYIFIAKDGTISSRGGGADSLADQLSKI